MGAFSKLKAYSFALLLSKPFNEWEAYELGLINDSGDLIKKPKTKKEKDSLDEFKNLIRKVKRILIRYIPDKKFFSFLISAYLLKSENKINNDIFIDKLNNTEHEILYNVLKTLYDENIQEIYMPLPKPRKDEKENDFISRCMITQSEEKDFENEDERKQALAICYSVYKRETKEEKELTFVDILND